MSCAHIIVVEPLVGIEPTISSLQVRCMAEYASRANALSILENALMHCLEVAPFAERTAAKLVVFYRLARDEVEAKNCCCGNDEE